MKPATDPAAMPSCGCCVASGAEGAPAGATMRPVPAPSPSGRCIVASVPIPGGESFLGTDDPVIVDDGEMRRDPCILAPFEMSPAAVTTAEFRAFVEDTGYVTDAEREGASFVFHTQLGRDAEDLGGIHGTPWWRAVRGACWSNVTGDRRDPVDRSGHPAVHVSWNDAAAFARWAGGRLPTEAEWEHAARGGMGDARYPWGDDDPEEGGGALCNIWSGSFPQAADPVRAATGTVPSRWGAPNPYGLYNLCGNVWEWTADRFANHIGPDPHRRLLKGGSFLCHVSYCFRYRIAARIGAAPHVTTSHQGFRIAFDDAAA